MDKFGNLGRCANRVFKGSRDDSPKEDLLMNLQVESMAQGRRLRVVVSGEVDVSNAEDLRAQIDAGLSDETVQEVEVDMAEVSYIDSTGIGVLVGSAHKAQDSGRVFQVLNPQANVLRILGLLGVDEVLGLKES